MRSGLSRTAYEQLRQTVRPDRADVPADENAAFREAAQHQTASGGERRALAHFSMLGIPACHWLVDRFTSDAEFLIRIGRVVPASRGAQASEAES
eukprot:3022120-Prymnesium_polylepis.1